MFKYRNSYYIAIDFDGTIVKHAFPNIGEEIDGAIDTIKELQKAGHRIILFTARGRNMNIDKRDFLQEAIDWLKERGIDPWAINHNHTQSMWTNSKKVYANYYIDDTAIGTHLTNDGCVDWKVVREQLKIRKIL